MISLPDAFFVTGTGTDVGKTVISGILLSGLEAKYWKPIQSGEPTDTNFLKEITGLPGETFHTERHKFSQPVSPHLASSLSGVEIQLQDFELPEHKDSHLIVEGAGGLLVPINERDLIIDLIDYLRLPVIIVALSGLGTINHTLLSISALNARNIPILGVVMNGEANQSNRDAIENFGKVPVIAQCERLAELNKDGLALAFREYFSPRTCRHLWRRKTLVHRSDD
ncbi:MAG TPA: dethiobiotin synthase [Drouetiella sp.]|jgi:dethiobiotin synthetase